MAASDPIPSGTGDPAALLDQIRGSTQEASYTLYGEGMAVIPRRHLDGLLKVAEAALKLADDWDAQAGEFADLAAEPNSVTHWQVIAYRDCAGELRETIRARLAAKGADDER